MLLRHLLKRIIESGTLKVIDARGRMHLFGDGQAPFSTIRLHDPALHYKLFYNPSLYTGEAYMDGTLTIEEGDLYGFLEIVLYNLNRMERLPAQFKSNLMERPLRPLRTFNPIERAKRNAAHHYDLSSALYDLFLDKDRQYSCAYFSSDNESLDVAQDNKKRHIASKLLRGAGQKVLDIGSGWGGLGMFLARMMDGIDVTGITVSEEQLKVSRARAAAVGLADRVRFELRDYRQETGRYDRIVSVGMFEHVGPSHYASYFAKINDLLTEVGVPCLDRPHGTTWRHKCVAPKIHLP